jgi:5-hydroxyisourate hydrolase
LGWLARRIRVDSRHSRANVFLMAAKLSTHVLDLTRGAPAAGMEIELWSLSGEPKQLKTVVTNADGRTDAPLLTGDELKSGDYQLVFKIHDYFARRGVASTFFVYAAVFFRVEDSTASYHVPLLVTPWSYNTYRGS